MIHLSIKNENQETVFQIRDFILANCAKEDLEIDIKSYLTFIDITAKNIRSYVHSHLDDDFNEIMVIEFYVINDEGTINHDVKSLKINVNTVNSYWG